MAEKKEKANRTMKKREYFIQQSANGTSWTTIEGGHETTTSGVSWIRANGKPGAKYRVCRVTSDVMSVQTYQQTRLMTEKDG